MEVCRPACWRGEFCRHRMLGWGWHGTADV